MIVRRVPFSYSFSNNTVMQHLLCAGHSNKGFRSELISSSWPAWEAGADVISLDRWGSGGQERLGLLIEVTQGAEDGGRLIT